MSASLFACAVALLPLADPQPPTGRIETTTPRKPHPLAPSLPELTEDEDKAIEAVIAGVPDDDTVELKLADDSIVRVALKDVKDAVLVYEWVGVAVLRRAWLNVDLVWTLALIATAALLLAY